MELRRRRRQQLRYRYLVMPRILSEHCLALGEQAAEAEEMAETEDHHHHHHHLDHRRRCHTKEFQEFQRKDS